MNKKIVVAGVVIIGTGILKAATGGKALTPVFIGGYIFIFLLAIADAFGGVASQFSGALAMIAMLSILLTQFPWATVLGLIGKGGGQAPQPQGKKG